MYSTHTHTVQFVLVWFGWAWISWEHDSHFNSPWSWKMCAILYRHVFKFITKTQSIANSSSILNIKWLRLSQGIHFISFIHLIQSFGVKQSWSEWWSIGSKPFLTHVWCTHVYIMACSPWWRGGKIMFDMHFNTHTCTQTNKKQPG